jgi:rhamnosyl/mannosyltransferase
MSKIKVLEVNKFYAPWVGGVETITKDIAEGLKEKVDMKVLVCQEKGKAVSEIYNDIPLTRAATFGILYSMPISLDFIFKLRKMAKNADILQFHAPFPLGDLAWLLSGYKGKVVVWWHSDIISQRKLLVLVKPIIKLFLKRADVIVVATKAHIENSKFLKPQRAKCRVIPFGLKFKDYEQVQIKNFLTARLNQPINKKLFFVGRIVYYKGIDVLLEAMQSVSGAELFIAGTGILENGMKDRVVQIGLSEKVHFLGYLPFEELKSAFSDSDIFVFPSNANVEAFGIAQMEAMFYGTPVVNTNLPTGVPLVSPDGETGITVPINDSAALASALQRLLDDDALRQQYGANAAKRVREFFDQYQMLESVYGCYEELMGVKLGD